MASFHAELKQRLEAAYAAGNYTLGWRLLASPAHVLDGADIAFLGLNPAGRLRPKDHPEFAMARGSAYVDEIWGDQQAPGTSPLQRQVQALFRHLGAEPAQVLAGNLVPFRSPDWASLSHQQAALSFGENLWRDILKRARPRLIITMGGVTYKSLRYMLGAQNSRSVSIGWGRVSGRVASFDDGHLVGLPHLSRFAIMTRDESTEGLRQLFGAHWMDR